MHILIEHWTPTSAWYELPSAERRAFADGILGAADAMAEQGITVVAWGLVDNQSNETDDMAFAVWQCPDEAALRTLRDGIRASGWYDLFRQVDLGGEARSPREVFDAHIALATSAS